MTLIELILAVGLVGILVAVAIPNMSQFIENNRIRAQAQQLSDFVSSARNLAISRGAVTNVCWNRTGGTETMQGAEIGPNQIGLVVDNEAAILETFQADETFIDVASAGAIDDDGDCITFSGQGRLAGVSVSFSACGKDGDLTNSYSVVVNTSGRTTTLSNEAGEQSDCSS